MTAIGVRVDYHVHTAYSYDSEAAPEAILRQALATSIGRLCITDHGTLEGAIVLARLAPPEVEIVVGCELDADDGTQVLALGVDRVVSPRPLFELLGAIKAQGGQILLPHPYRRGSGVFRPELRRSEGFIADVLGEADLVECFNGRDTYDNNRRNAGFAAQVGIVAVAGSDAHTEGEVGSVYVEYLERPFTHGAAPRRLWFADQLPHRESSVKRAIMERYHRHERQLPAFVGSGYRSVRRRLHRDRARVARGAPRFQFELPASSDGADGARATVTSPQDGFAS